MRISFGDMLFKVPGDEFNNINKKDHLRIENIQKMEFEGVDEESGGTTATLLNKFENLNFCDKHGRLSPPLLNINFPYIKEGSLTDYAEVFLSTLAGPCEWEQKTLTEILTHLKVMAKGHGIQLTEIALQGPELAYLDKKVLFQLADKAEQNVSGSGAIFSNKVFEQNLCETPNNRPMLLKICAAGATAAQIRILAGGVRSHFPSLYLSKTEEELEDGIQGAVGFYFNDVVIEIGNFFECAPFAKQALILNIGVEELDVYLHSGLTSLLQALFDLGYHLATPTREIHRSTCALSEYLYETLSGTFVWDPYLFSLCTQITLNTNGELGPQLADCITSVIYRFKRSSADLTAFAALALEVYLRNISELTLKDQDFDEMWSLLYPEASDLNTLKNHRNLVEARLLNQLSIMSLLLPLYLGGLIHDSSDLESRMLVTSDLWYRGPDPMMKVSVKQADHWLSIDLPFDYARWQHAIAETCENIVCHKVMPKVEVSQMSMALSLVSRAIQVNEAFVAMADRLKRCFIDIHKTADVLLATHSEYLKFIGFCLYFIEYAFEQNVSKVEVLFQGLLPLLQVNSVMLHPFAIRVAENLFGFKLKEISPGEIKSHLVFRLCHYALFSDHLEVQKMILGRLSKTPEVLRVEGFEAYTLQLLNQIAVYDQNLAIKITSKLLKNEDTDLNSSDTCFYDELFWLVMKLQSDLLNNAALSEIERLSCLNSTIKILLDHNHETQFAFLPRDLQQFNTLITYSNRHLPRVDAGWINLFTRVCYEYEDLSKLALREMVTCLEKIVENRCRHEDLQQIYQLLNHSNMSELLKQHGLKESLERTSEYISGSLRSADFYKRFDKKDEGDDQGAFEPCMFLNQEEKWTDRLNRIDEAINQEKFLELETALSLNQDFYFSNLDADLIWHLLNKGIGFAQIEQDDLKKQRMAVLLNQILEASSLEQKSEQVCMFVGKLKEIENTLKTTLEISLMHHAEAFDFEASISIVSHFLAVNNLPAATQGMSQILQACKGLDAKSLERLKKYIIKRFFKHLLTKNKTHDKVLGVNWELALKMLIRHQKIYEELLAKHAFLELIFNLVASCPQRSLSGLCDLAVLLDQAEAQHEVRNSRLLLDYPKIFMKLMSTHLPWNKESSSLLIRHLDTVPADFDDNLLWELALLYETKWEENSPDEALPIGFKWKEAPALESIIKRGLNSMSQLNRKRFQELSMRLNVDHDFNIVSCMHSCNVNINATFVHAIQDIYGLKIFNILKQLTTTRQKQEFVKWLLNHWERATFTENEEPKTRLAMNTLLWGVLKDLSEAEMESLGRNGVAEALFNYINFAVSKYTSNDKIANLLFNESFKFIFSNHQLSQIKVNFVMAFYRQDALEHASSFTALLKILLLYTEALMFTGSKGYLTICHEMVMLSWIKRDEIRNFLVEYIVKLNLIGNGYQFIETLQNMHITYIKYSFPKYQMSSKLAFVLGYLDFTLVVNGLFQNGAFDSKYFEKFMVLFAAYYPNSIADIAEEKDVQAIDSLRKKLFRQPRNACKLESAIESALWFCCLAKAHQNMFHGERYKEYISTLTELSKRYQGVLDEKCQAIQISFEALKEKKGRRLKKK